MHFLFAWRYFKAKKSTNAINIIAWISVMAIAFATAALLTLWSVFNGFESLVKSLYATFYTDMRVTSVRGKTLTLTKEQLSRLRNLNGVAHLSLVAEEKALLQQGDNQALIQLKGVDSQYTSVAAILPAIVRGQYNLGNADTPGIVLGVGVESAIQVLSDRNIGSLLLYLPRKDVDDLSDPLAAFNEGLVYPTGSFAVQQDFDNSYALTNLDFAKRYLGFATDEYSAAEIALRPQAGEVEVKKEIQQALGNSYLVQTRYEQNSSLYNVMRLEKFFIYAIFLLVLIVAAFNMIGALTMLVLEKQKDIQVLQAMGARRGWIQRLFLTEGILLAGIGTGAGILLALLLIYLQLQFKLIPLEGNSFVIDHYPVKPEWIDFVVVVLTVLSIALGASWIPAARAARQRFELKN